MAIQSLPAIEFLVYSPKSIQKWLEIFGIGV